MSNDQIGKNKIDFESESHAARKARLLGTALVALGVVVLIGVVAALTFLGIAALMRGNWLFLLLCAVGIAALSWLLGRLMRVAANQNKKPLG